MVSDASLREQRNFKTYTDYLKSLQKEWPEYNQLYRQFVTANHGNSSSLTLYDFPSNGGLTHETRSSRNSETQDGGDRDRWRQRELLPG